MGVPVVLAGAAFVFLKGINWKEFACIAAACLVVAGSSAGIVSCGNKTDNEILNGHVAKKYSHHVSCEHSYQCHCHEECTGTGKNRSCSTVCQTCYEHDYDVDWTVADDIGQVWNIHRIDSQGLRQPPRYTAVVIGEPTSGDHTYVNYVKAAPGTLFRRTGLKEKYAGTLPKEPQYIYDYYHLDRFISVGVNVPDTEAWNWDLSVINADLGAPKQANIILVLVKNQSQEWYYALEEKWIGGKKNDVVLVVSVDSDMTPQWATVMAWTTSDIFKVKLRDDVMQHGVLKRDTLMNDIRNNVSQYFKRKPMADFQYLESEIVPTTTEWVVTLIIALIVGIGLTWFFEVSDIFEAGDQDEFGYSARRRRQRWC